MRMIKLCVGVPDEVPNIEAIAILHQCMASIDAYNITVGYGFYNNLHHRTLIMEVYDESQGIVEYEIQQGLKQYLSKTSQQSGLLITYEARGNLISFDGSS